MSIQEKFKNLPVSEVADEICASLASHPRLLVTAPPGAGKSTLLPLVLLDHFKEGKIIMLEPRRLAARQVARRMAAMLGESPGETVGYRMRFETRISPTTRIEVVTEGVMERMLIEDPTLEGVAVVVFDEFHERSLASDLSMTLVRDIQNVLRPELRILVMSATIEAEEMKRRLNAHHVHSPGKIYPVEIRYGDDYDLKDCVLTVARSVRKVLSAHTGNILVFLPGQAEIQKCRDLLLANITDVEVLPLYGMLPQEQQQRVFDCGSDGKRRIILASPIAETSLTIEGISVVIDSGLCRTPVYEPSTGLRRLVTGRISMDMANQRSGRAGRLGPGVCYRLWSKATESRMKENRQPEILSTDLSSMLLSTTLWGEKEPLRLPWITPPPEGHIKEGIRLLTDLGCIEDGKLTEKGMKVAELPSHPRISSMLIESGANSGLASDIAALLEEKDPLPSETDADICTRIALLQQYRNRGNCPPAWKRIEQVSAQYRKLMKARPFMGKVDPEEVGGLVAMAFPERIAMRDDSGKYKLAFGGKEVTLHPDDDLARYEFLATAAMDRRIFLCAPISRRLAESKGRWREVAKWNSVEKRAVVREELQLGILTLATRKSNGNIQDQIAAVVAAAAPKEGLSMFDFNEEVQSLQLRISVASLWHPEFDFPDISTEKLLARAAEWLPLYIGRATTAQELRKIDMRNVILGLLTYEQQAELEKIAPTQIKLPSGRNVRIRYRRGADAPVVSARLQDCFGLMHTPRVDNGKRQVLMELLSPGFKPVQLTQDMEGFWRTTYFEVRKELRRRYPKHKWPENPFNPNGD
ncbi:MAG: ATP-dependent helicase HrpB [Bacteroidales bacterium]|nr:ATP-dependent helicase HrpB [Bacteroidales bacterium]